MGGDLTKREANRANSGKGLLFVKSGRQALPLFPERIGANAGEKLAGGLQMGCGMLYNLDKGVSPPSILPAAEGRSCE